MRPSNKQRSRNKPSSGNGHNNQRQRMGNIINRVFESAGPDGKVRGTPQQIIDKYHALARDAQLSGDRVAAESYQQHAEHYSRILGEAQRQQQDTRFGGGGTERDEGGRSDEQPEMPPRQPAPAPVAAGLTTIDTGDGDDFSGPIETPEDRRAPPREPAPVVREASAPEARNGAGFPAAEAEAAAPDAAEPAAQAPKRSRPRRRPKPEAEAPEAPASAQAE